MVCAVNKIDSNITGLRYAQEDCLKLLPGVNGADAVWYPLEPNSYNDFGAQSTLVTREPINASRQKKKGVITDIDASGGINQDFTQSNMARLLQGYFFADARERIATAPINGGTARTATGVDNAGVVTITPALAAAPLVNALVFAKGFGLAANNGLKKLTAATTTQLTLSGSNTEASPPAAASLRVVGQEFAAGDVAISYTAGNLPVMTSVAFDFTTLALLPGEWLFVGGDATANRFANNVGFARVSSVAAHAITFDKTDWAPVTEAGTGKSIRVFFGTVIRNEKDPTLIKRRSYQLERTLGQDIAGTQSEYLIGAVPNELTLNVSQADKVHADLTFVACDDVFRDGSTGLKPGARPDLVAADAFNTSSDFRRIRLATVDSADSFNNPLIAFVQELTLTVNNNVSPSKALGVIGAFDTDVGDFEVGGNMTAYFADTRGPAAVRNNSDVTLDLIIVKANSGVLFDIPLLALGDGRLSVEKDQSITMALETNAAESKFGHTLLFMTFEYLPTVANPKTT